MYKYSDGIIRNAMPFTFEDVQYGMDVFTHWTPEQLAEVGVKEFIEDAVPVGYDSGVPVDVESATQVHRTYPNPVYRFERVKQEYMNKINTIRKGKEEDGFIYDPAGVNVFIDTDIKGSLRMTQMAMVFQADPSHVEMWKAKDPETRVDKWFSLDAAKYAAIQAAGQEYVRACFVRQEALQSELNSLPEEVARYIAFADKINTGWPS